MQLEPVYSTIIGSSADAIPQIVSLHVPEGSLIADLTYAKGVFWRQVPPMLYRVLRCDLAGWPGLDLRCDLRHAPFRSGSLDCVVIDPPYWNASTVARTDGVRDSYNLASCMTPDAINDLYRAGLWEAARVLRKRGVLIVKCQNFVDGGRQHWIEIAIYNRAYTIGFQAIDQFHVVPKTRPIMRNNGRQQHARKWGSTFWVFRNP